MTEMQAFELRLSQVEAALHQITRELKQEPPKAGIRAVIGTFANRPEYDEVLRLATEWRKAHNVIEDDFDSAEPSE